METILGILGSRGIHLAVQGCERHNRALVVESGVGAVFSGNCLSVHPTLHAGGSGQLSLLVYVQDWVEGIYQGSCAGWYIGLCKIGTYVKFSGSAIRYFERDWSCPCNGTGASRPKLIGCACAHYPQDAIRKIWEWIKEIKVFKRDRFNS